MDGTVGSTCRHSRVVVLAALLGFAAPGFGAAQTGTATLHGRVVDDGATPLADVRVIARSSALIGDRETRTGRDGAYVLALLPPGDYVVSLEREGFVTVRRTLHLSPLETSGTVTTMAAAGDPDELITVDIEPENFLEHPTASTTRQSWLLTLPIEGGLFSALTLAPGPFGPEAADLAVTIDGTPVRFPEPGHGAPLLDPGGAATGETTAVLAGAPPRLTRFRSGAIDLTTTRDAARPSGLVLATITGADRLADAIDRAGSTRGAAWGAEFAVSPTPGSSRTLLFAAGRRHSVPVTSHALLTDASLPVETTEHFWELRVTRALGMQHRLSALVLDGVRDLRGIPPLGAIAAEHDLAAEDRGHSQTLGAASYAGVLAGDLYLSARVSGERRDARWLDTATTIAAPLVLDRQTGVAAGATNGCADCRIDRRTVGSWSVEAVRPVVFAGQTHELAVGAHGDRGALALPEAPAGGALTLLATRLDGGPVLEGNGSSWIVRRTGPIDGFDYASNGLFVSDTWRPGPGLSVVVGTHWDRQRLERASTGEDVLVRTGFGPRAYVTWRPGDSWTIDGGAARIESDLLHVPGVTLAPAGDWFAYDGPPLDAAGTLAWLGADPGTPRFSGASAPVAALASRGRAALGPTLEWTVGTSRRIGEAVRLRADVVWRRTAPLDDPAGAGVWPATEVTARAFERPADVDLGLLTRRYTGLAVQGHYELGLQAGVSAHYTLSRSWGESTAAAATVPAAAWAAPPGDLADDRRHRLAVWTHLLPFESEEQGRLDLTLLQLVQSGAPYGVVSWIDAAPAGSGTPRPLPYYFTARDAFHGKTALRTDLAVTWSRVMPGTLRTRLLVRFHALNLFDKERLQRPAAFQAARTAFSHPSSFDRFDPFSEAPQPGTHWAVDERLTRRLDTAAETMPRAYRLSVGLSF